MPFSAHLYLLKYFGPRFFVYRMACKQREAYSKEKMHAYQCTKIRELIAHAYAHVPFYRDAMKKNNLTPNDIKSPDDLMKLPVIDKDIIKANYTSFKADNMHEFRPVKKQTSGSTGNAFHFLIDHNVMTYIDTIGWRRFNWAKYRMGDPHVIIRQPLGYRAQKIKKEILYFYDPLMKMLEINTSCLNEKSLGQCFDLMEKYKTKVLITYPSYMPVLSDYAERAKRKPGLKTIISGAEKLYPEQRNRAEKVFETKVYNFYGMEERLVYGSECKIGNMHLYFDAGILEIMKDGQRCKPGDIGEFVCTGLHNRSMSLIRYAIGDYGYIQDGPCACGSHMPIIVILGGRNKDLIVTRKGVRCIEPEHAFLDNEHNKIDKFQIYQETIDEIILKIVPREGFSANDGQYLQERYFNLLERDVNVKVECVDDITREASGKLIYVKSKIYRNQYLKPITSKVAQT